jgi:hypothetical protein
LLHLYIERGRPKSTALLNKNMPVGKVGFFLTGGLQGRAKGEVASKFNPSSCMHRYEEERGSSLQVAQLSQACEVIPFGPSLKDLAIPDTIDCDVLGIHGLPGR